LPAPPTRTGGYVFAGWNTAADGTGAAFEAATPVTANLIVYAQWVVSYSYTVTFNSNDGTTAANPPTKTVLEPATTVGTLPVPPEKTGYIFGGWNTNVSEAYGMPFTATTPVTANLIVYAQWREYNYTVTFDENGGNVPADPLTRMVSSPATTVGTLPAPPKRTGYIFAGWNTAKDGTGAVFDATTTVTTNLKVYARWIADETLDTSIVLRFDDPGLTAWDQAVVGDTFTIKKGGADKTIALGSGWTSPIWRVDGKDRGTGSSFTLNATHYNVGGHTLQVTASQGGRTWSKTVPFTVTSGVSGLALNKPALTLAPGQSEKLLPIFTPANAADKSVSWSVVSVNPAGAVTVDPDTGLVSAVSAGTATIRATSNDNPTAYAGCAVTVASTQGIVLRFDDPGTGAWDSVAVGETFTLYQNGTAPEEPSSKTIALESGWASPDWRVDGKSRGTGNSLTLNAGDYNVGGHTLQVTVSQGGTAWSKTVSFTVVATVTGLSLNKTALSLSPGQSEKLLPLVVPANAADKSVSWSVSPAGAVTVDSTGLVTAVSIGTATVRATSNDTATEWAECTVTVGAPQGIVLRFDDPGAGAWASEEVGETFTISKAGPDKTITLTGSWDLIPPPDWRVDGRPMGGAAATAIINAVNYTVGGHTLQVTVYKDGKPWSKTVTFTVTN
jgi:uncharacterized repeat protein (TIGR02543 family)